MSSELSGPLVERAVQRSRRLIEADLADRLDSAAEALGIELALRAEGATSSIRLDEIKGSLLLALASVRDTTHAAITALNGAMSSAKDDPEALATSTRARGLLTEIHDVAGGGGPAGPGRGRRLGAREQRDRRERRADGRDAHRGPPRAA